MAINFNVFNEKLIDIKFIINNKSQDFSRDVLSQKIWTFYLNRSQDFKVFNQKFGLKSKLIETIRKHLAQSENKFAELFVIGSTANGFATVDSDIDLSFIVDHLIYGLDLAKSTKLSILGRIQRILSQNGFNLIDCQLIEARVPILRYRDGLTGIQVEINCNNQIGIRNTRLLYCYSKHWRVVPICLSIKKWAKDNKIIDSFSGALSSYCMELMVIFYLQTCRPPVLPCLQQTNPDLFDRFTDIKSYTEMPDLNVLLPFISLNSESLSRLFVGFFKYYLFKFDFAKHVASVRLGKVFSKDDIAFREDPIQWQFICIEEPFSGCNCGRTVYDSEGYNRVVDGFKDMYRKSRDFIESRCNCD